MFLQLALTVMIKTLIKMRMYDLQLTHKSQKLSENVDLGCSIQILCLLFYLRLAHLRHGYQLLMGNISCQVFPLFLPLFLKKFDVLFPVCSRCVLSGLEYI